jgi:isocitrate/isopropylmalate dehydrogenase
LTPGQIEEVVEVACGYVAGEINSLVSVDKANLMATGRLWRKIVTRVAKERGLECRHVYVDQCAFELAKHGLPDAVMVTEGLLGDILSDLAAAIAGSIALCSSASIHPGPPHKGRCVGLFEPIHGSAPDIVGRNCANPAGAYLALAAALECFPETADFAVTIRQALAGALRAGPTTPDMAAQGRAVATTTEFARHVNAIYHDLTADSA